MKDEELQRLLARGRLGGPSRERVLERVLDRVAPARPKRRPWLVPLVLAFGSGVAILVLVARPRPDDARWGAKGGPTGQPVALEARCGDAPACEPGATLMFSVFGAPTPGYLSAYSSRVGSGERVWYFSADTESPRVPASDQGTQPAGRGIVIGPEHTPGNYQVHLFLSTTPLTQAALLAGGDPRIVARAVVPISVVPATTSPSAPR
jgi:hypothetical protein